MASDFVDPEALKKISVSRLIERIPVLDRERQKTSIGVTVPCREENLLKNCYKIIFERFLKKIFIRIVPKTGGEGQEKEVKSYGGI